MGGSGTGSGGLGVNGKSKGKGNVIDVGEASVYLRGCAVRQSECLGQSLRCRIEVLAVAEGSLEQLAMQNRRWFGDENRR